MAQDGSDLVALQEMSCNDLVQKTGWPELGLEFMGILHFPVGQSIGAIIGGTWYPIFRNIQKKTSIWPKVRGS